jgi:hypothetical protein
MSDAQEALPSHQTKAGNPRMGIKEESEDHPQWGSGGASLGGEGAAWTSQPSPGGSSSKQEPLAASAYTEKPPAASAYAASAHSALAASAYTRKRADGGYGGTNTAGTSTAGTLATKSVRTPPLARPPPPPAPPAAMVPPPPAKTAPPAEVPSFPPLRNLEKVQRKPPGAVARAERALVKSRALIDAKEKHWEDYDDEQARTLDKSSSYASEAKSSSYASEAEQRWQGEGWSAASSSWGEWQPYDGFKWEVASQEEWQPYDQRQYDQDNESDSSLGSIRVKEGKLLRKHPGCRSGSPSRSRSRSHSRSVKLFEEGDTVQLADLDKNPEMNGQLAKIVLVSNRAGCKLYDVKITQGTRKGTLRRIGGRYLRTVPSQKSSRVYL